MKPYRDPLALPGLRPLLLVTIVARVPVAATAVVMTLHVLDPGRWLCRQTSRRRTHQRENRDSATVNANSTPNSRHCRSQNFEPGT